MDLEFQGQLTSVFAIDSATQLLILGMVLVIADSYVFHSFSVFCSNREHNNQLDFQLDDHLDPQLNEIHLLENHL